VTTFNDDLYAGVTLIGNPRIAKSVDDGSTWTSVLDATAYSLVEKDGTLYASSADTTNSAIYTSTDGSNWNKSTLVFNPLP